MSSAPRRLVGRRPTSRMSTHARPAQPGGRPQAPRRGRPAARSRRARRRPHRGIPAGRDGAPRCRTRRLPRPQSATRLRADDRGQDGPWANAAGHDINYISLAGRSPTSVAGQPPTPPLNLVGDYGGGSMFLAFGVVCALLEAQRSGGRAGRRCRDGRRCALLMQMFWTLREIGAFDEHARGTNLLDTGAHFYDVYECSDGEYVSIGSLEPQFYAELLQRSISMATSRSPPRWTAPRGLLKQRLAEIFRTRSRDDWCAPPRHHRRLLRPVLTMSEAAVHPHNSRAARSSTSMAGSSRRRRHDSAAPRVDRRAPAHPGEHTREILADGTHRPRRRGAPSSTHRGLVGDVTCRRWCSVVRERRRRRGRRQRSVGVPAITVLASATTSRLDAATRRRAHDEAGWVSRRPPDEAPRRTMPTR